MSLKPVPVCNSCARCSEVSISCTTCFQICCATCFNLQIDLFDALTNGANDTAAVRICPKCIGRIKQKQAEQPCAARERELCKLHGKPRNLFCLNCVVCICGDCFGEKDEHTMHHIDNKTVVYQEKFAEVEQKLTDAEKIVAGSSIYENNLKTIEKEERTILEAVGAIAADSISGLTSLTVKRKATLNHKIQALADKGQRLSELRKIIRDLSAEDFLAQRLKIEQQCDEIINGVEPNCVREPIDDLKCDLIPPYHFAQFTCAGFATAASSYVFIMHSANVAWNVTFSKSKMLQLHLSASDGGIFKFHHSVVVIISHEDSTKEIRKTFELGDSIHTFEVVPMSYLTKHGFFNSTGGFMLKIGIRPVNSIVEKMLLHYHCKKLKDECKILQRQLDTVTSGVEWNYYTAHLKLQLAKLEIAGMERFGTTIIDNDGRVWGLKVLPTMIHKNPSQVEAYVVLIKGSPTLCEYSIQLKHTNAAQSIVKQDRNYFNRRDAHGWKCFIKWNQIDDVGFHPDGYVLFRYGVIPLSTGEI